MNENERSALIDRAIDKDQLIVLSAELLRENLLIHTRGRKVVMENLTLIENIIESAKENSRLATSFGRMSLTK